MTQLYHTFLYQPIFNLLIFIYNSIPLQDMGIAIILLTALIRLVLWPLSKKQIVAQKHLKELQPKIEEIKKKFKDDPQQRNMETLKLYKENKANPASSCVTLLIQLPILIAMFSVFRDGLKPEALSNLYSFVAKPEVIDKLFLNIAYFDLSRPNIILTILTALVQFWQSKMLSIAPSAVKNGASKDESMQTAINKQMLYMMPIITIVMGMTLPSGLMLYWLVSTLLLGVQQWFELKKNDHVPQNLVNPS